MNAELPQPHSQLPLMDGSSRRHPHSHTAVASLRGKQRRRLRLPGSFLGASTSSSLRALLTGSSQQSFGGGSSIPTSHRTKPRPERSGSATPGDGRAGPAEAGTAEAELKGATFSEGRGLGYELNLPEPQFPHTPEPFRCIRLWGIN